MLKTLAALAVIIFSAPAHAQSPDPAVPGFVPIVLDERTFNELIVYIGDIPTKYGALLLNAMGALRQHSIQQQKAIQQKLAEEAAKPAAKKD